MQFRRNAKSGPVRKAGYCWRRHIRGMKQTSRCHQSISAFGGHSGHRSDFVTDRSSSIHILNRNYLVGANRTFDLAREHDQHAIRAPNSAVAQARLHGLHGRAGSGLFAQLWANQLPLFLRRRPDHHAGRHF
jgi:hypothetical protein